MVNDREGPALNPAEQIAYLESFGFIVLRKAFRRDEMDFISREVDRVLEADRNGKPFRGKSRQGVYGGVENSPVLRPLVDDDRIYDPVHGILGAGMIWHASDINLFVGDTPWHGDGAWGERLRSIKVAFYLDSVTRDTGCLRVVPGGRRPPSDELLKALRPDPLVVEPAPFGLSPSDIRAWRWSRSRATSSS